MSEAAKQLDPITQATVTIVWVIVLNKPFYPVYVWYLVGNGVAASLGTLLSAPLFLAIPFVARRSSLAARIGMGGAVEPCAPRGGRSGDCLAREFFGAGAFLFY